MIPHIKHRWVAAMRSGKYQQGRGLLNWNDQFCCLGVLCEIAFEDGILTKSLDSRGRTVYSPADGSRHGDQDPDGTHLLPTVVQDWAGLTLNPSVDGRPLSARNDNGDSFADIADLIEENL